MNNDASLSDTVTCLLAAVKTRPGDVPGRLALAEALILSGALERAENQLAAAAQLDHAMPVRIGRLRHLVRAEAARHAWFLTGAVPALAGVPGPGQKAAIALFLAAKDGDASAAAEAAEIARPPLPGTLDGEPFDDFRDLDDLCAGFLEILTADGGYLWIDWPSVESLSFTPPARPIDLLWREARLVFHDGRAADIVVPAQYVLADAGDEHRLARRTDWRTEAGLVRGAGQRCFLVGDEDRGILSMTELRFAPPP